MLPFNFEVLMDNDLIKELNILTEYAYRSNDLSTMDLTIIASINEHLASVLAK